MSDALKAGMSEILTQDLTAENANLRARLAAMTALMFECAEYVSGVNVRLCEQIGAARKAAGEVQL